jgi:hypothetical protein
MGNNSLRFKRNAAPAKAGAHHVYPYITSLVVFG